MRKHLIWLSMAMLVACGGGDEAAAPRVPTVATVELSQTTATMTVGDVLALAAQARDAAGLVLAGRATTWSTSDPAVATVSSGFVTAVAPGSATITATIDQQAAQLALIVRRRPVAKVVVTPIRNYVRVGATLALSAALQDASGTVLTDRVVAWTSSDDAKATVSTSGAVTGVADGLVTITATSEGVAAAVTVSVIILPSPVIAAISPATLTPGGTATLDGSNFSTVASEDTVAIGGVAATVTSATATRLVVSLPAQFPCLPTGPVDVTVTNGGGPGARAHPLQVARQRTLAVGEQLVLAGAELGCNELAPGASHYYLTFFNTSVVPSSRTSVTLTGRAIGAGAPGAPATSASRSLVPHPLLSALARRGALSGAIADRVRADRALRETTRRAHFDRLSRDRRLIREFSSHRSRYLRAAARTGPGRLGTGGVARVSSVMPAPTALGDTMTLKVPTSGCDAFRSVSARVVYSGVHTIIFEDLAGPLAGQLGVSYQQFGTLFDETLFPLEENFGDIDAFDVAGQLQNPGKVLMLFSPVVNSQGAGLLGFVTGCDFFPASEPGFEASNQTKIFYARAALRAVPNTTTGIDFDAQGTWLLTMPATLVHEAKHIVSLAERLSRQANDGEESWLEEATAQIAAELYGRTVWNDVRWKQNATYSQSAYCEVRNLFAPASFPQCSSYTYNVSDNFFALESYYGDVESHSFLSPGSRDGTIYGSAWQFVRWLVDEYGGATESTLLRALVQEPTLFGVGNVQDKTGKPFADLLADYATALIADDAPGYTPRAESRALLRSWNTRSMFSGLNDDFDGLTDFPLHTQVASFGTFAVALPPIAGGSAGYVDLTGTSTTPQLLDLSTLPATTRIRLSILRVQ